MNARFEKGKFQRDLVIVCKMGHGAQDLIEFLTDEKRNLQLKDLPPAVEYSKDAEAYVFAFYYQQNADVARKQFQPLIEEFLNQKTPK